jgi:2-desacetyl-2-hydroxyethyl bacteriochlorophyllide A dehydrogenase
VKAVAWHGPYDVRLTDTAVPRLAGERDAIVRVALTAICGTDLHPYRGEIASFTPGTVTGHEFTGVVEEVGSQVGHVRPGDRVLASDIIACGRCWYCRQGWHYQCDHVGLFGYGTVVGSTAVPGGHAEYVRVPFADVVLSRIPDDVADEQALFIGDILTTGYTCAVGGGIQPGDAVAVVGCGPVGLLATKVAQLLGAGRVLGVDPLPGRRAIAAAQGAEPLAPDDELLARVRDLTEGRGVDVALEAVGTDAALRTALDVVRPRGVVCAVGAHASDAMPMSTRQAFAKELTLRFAVGDPISTRDRLIRIVRQRRIDPTFVISHRLPLEDAAEGFRRFDRADATKVVLTL